MKLVIRQYLAALREREELDAILPDLLSQMGLTVFSRPRRGTRQDGVDVGAVGKIEGGEESVYLFSIKAGDLTRAAWDGNPQALRPSLNAIVGTYIRNRLPVEHRSKPVVVCVCVGGDVREEVRPDLVSYFENCGTVGSGSASRVAFEEWNGDRLTKEVEQHFLREELLPQGARSSLRKAIALLDEPDSSFGHFEALAKSLLPSQSVDAEAITGIRQLGLCLRILFVWSREAGNSEAAYRSGELALLFGWNVFKRFADTRSKAAISIRDAFESIYGAYHEICRDFLRGAVVPHAVRLHGLSTAVRGSCHLDVNLKLFDLVGRVGVAGLWALWAANQTKVEDERSGLLEEARLFRQTIKAMVANNPALLLPATEDQSIDLSIAFYLLAFDGQDRAFLRDWLREIFGRTGFALRVHGSYPCTLPTYTELLEHPKSRDDEYRREATQGSVLFPLIAVWAALLEDEELFQRIAPLKKEVLSHCTFQYWFPDETTEDFLYVGGGSHGASLTDMSVEQPQAEFLKQMFSECEALSDFEELSAVKLGWWPLVAVACRHHRLPLPLHFLRGFLPQQPGSGNDEEQVEAEES